MLGKDLAGIVFFKGPFGPLSQPAQQGGVIHQPCHTAGQGRLSRLGKTRPFSPSWISRGLPPISLTTAGRPKLMPSSRERLVPSLSVEALI